MSLNRKGYMLVEIIVASVLAMSIAYYLLNLTYKFKDTNEDIYQSYFYTQDKFLITKNVMSDLERGVVGTIAAYANTIDFELHILDGGIEVVEKRRLIMNKEAGKSVLEYGKIGNDNNFVTSDVSYYKKELADSLIVDNLEVDWSYNEAVTIVIPVQSIYDDGDYSIRLFANRYVIQDL